MKNLRFALASAWLLACQAASAEPVSAAPTAVPVPAAAKVPQWPGVAPFSADSHNPSIRSGDVELVHSAEPLGGFLVKVSGHSMAVGSAPVLVGYVHEGRMRWMDCSTNSIRDGAVTGSQTLVTASFQCTDLDGGQWRFSRQFRAQGQPGAIDVQTEVTIDKDRAIAFLPMMVLFAGVGSFGQDKGQALLPGLEYLENEPSSSEADVIGPTANRLIPDSAKITFPLMALQADERYVALNWQMRPYLSALFDSPDRHFNSGGHVMGLMFPGCNGVDREEGSLLPRVAENVRAGNTIRLRATILGGNGETVVSAVQHFCGLHPLPSVPPAPELQAYVSQTAAGWLDSKIRQGTLVRHAVAEGGFPPQPAGDAAIWMEWLAQFDTQPSQVLRLRQTATNVLSAVPAAALNSAGVGHVRYPVESLVFGHVQETAELATQTASSLLSNFAPDGSLHYRSKPGGPDFSKTHYTNSASGYAAAAVSDLLVAASFSGQPDLIDAAIKELRTLSCFNNAVPRGAQTWECPLHTPDILAAAHMVKANTLGYQLTGENQFLEQARYWAWSGIPFVYLVNPTEKPVGVYSTIAVFGATQWRAPVWFGLPVQWCGLVYADALYTLARLDPQGIWKRVADGVTVSGMQQSWPEEDPAFKGLLPDSFALRDQRRNGPAINPATLQACAAHFFGPVPVYDFFCFTNSHLLVHAPGQISNPDESKGSVRFKIRPWESRSYYLLVNGVGPGPHLKINGKAVDLAVAHEFFPDQKRLIVQARGDADIEIRP